MGCAASKAPPKRDPVEELIEEVHAQQGRESGGGVTLDLSAAPAGADAPAGKLAELGLSLNGKVPDAAWACVGVTTLSLKGNHLGSLSPKLAQLSALRVLDVSENGLTALPDEELPALDLPEFTTLNAGGNPREAAWKSSTLTPSSRPDV